MELNMNFEMLGIIKKDEEIKMFGSFFIYIRTLLTD